MVTDMNKHMMKLTNRIHSRRKILCVALTQLADKFQALEYSNNPIESAKAEFLQSVMNCKQMSTESMNSHESDVREVISDYRRLNAMCLRKFERFHRNIVDTDFQPHSLITLMRQLSETTGANSNSSTNVQNTASTPVAGGSRNQGDPNHRGHSSFVQSAPHQNVAPVPIHSQVQPNYMFPNVPLPYAGLAPSHTYQRNPQMAPFQLAHLIPMPQPSSVILVNGQRSFPATPRHTMILRSHDTLPTSNTSGNSSGNI